MGETNEDFVVRIMNHCPYGALIQGMVIDALSQYAATAAVERIPENNLIHPDAWQGCAQWLKDELTAKYGAQRETA